ncbi:MAG: hypothetical protein GY754_21740 [bacterium]|nr:hypothetical protein [bacterium]
MNQDYKQLAEQMNLNPQRAPRHEGEFTESFIEYLKLLYSEEEAAIVKYLKPVPKFTSTEDLARETGNKEKAVMETLDSLRKRNRLLGMGNLFALPHMPLIVNVHQLRTELEPDDIKAAELYLDFFIEKKYSRYYETSEKGTPVFRAVPVEKTIKFDEKILNYEEAEQFIRTMDHDNYCLTPCPCRTRTDKLGIRECKETFPIASCLHLGIMAQHLISIGVGQKITKDEAVDYVKDMIDKGLICCTDNAMTKNSIICLCCGCCCSQIRGRTRWDNMDAVAPSNFIPVSNEDCTSCGKCQKRCLLGAITIDKEAKMVVVDESKCVGCGVCAVTCPKDSLRLVRQRDNEPFTSVGQMLKTINMENVK